MPLYLLFFPPARPPTHLLACLQGTTLLKYGRHGAPKIHYFRLSTDDTELQWESKVRPFTHDVVTELHLVGPVVTAVRVIHTMWASDKP